MIPSLLIVDDAVCIHRLVRAGLSDVRMKIWSAFSGEEALSMLEETEPDIVLLDIEMPGMNGTEVLRRLRSERSQLDVDVIFLSATTLGEQSPHGVETMVADFITKPFRVHQLRSQVLSLLRMRSSRGGSHLEATFIETTHQALAAKFA